MSWICETRTKYNNSFNLNNKSFECKLPPLLPESKFFFCCNKTYLKVNMASIWHWCVYSIFIFLAKEFRNQRRHKENKIDQRRNYETSETVDNDENDI